MIDDVIAAWGGLPPLVNSVVSPIILTRQESPESCYLLLSSDTGGGSSCSQGDDERSFSWGNLLHSLITIQPVTSQHNLSLPFLASYQSNFKFTRISQTTFTSLILHFGWEILTWRSAVESSRINHFNSEKVSPSLFIITRNEKTQGFVKIQY